MGQGPARSLDVLRRAWKQVKHPQIAKEAYACSGAIADYEFFLELHDYLCKTNKLEEFIKVGAVRNPEQDLAFAHLVKSYDKAKVLKNIAEVMYDKLTVTQRIEAACLVTDVSESDANPELVFELHIYDSDADRCANLNIELIAERVVKGLDDWSVGAVFIERKNKDVQ